MAKCDKRTAAAAIRRQQAARGRGQIEELQVQIQDLQAQIQQIMQYTNSVEARAVEAEVALAAAMGVTLAAAAAADLVDDEVSDNIERLYDSDWCAVGMDGAALSGSSFVVGPVHHTQVIRRLFPPGSPQRRRSRGPDLMGEEMPQEFRLPSPAERLGDAQVHRLRGRGQGRIRQSCCALLLFLVLVILLEGQFLQIVKLPNKEGCPAAAAAGRGQGISDLKDGLLEVNALFQAKYGESLEDCKDEGDALYDMTGATWNVTVGRVAIEQRQAYQVKLSFLEDSLEELEDHSFTLEELEDHGESVFDGDATSWIVSVGRDTAEQKDVYDGKLGSLESSLEEVDVLFRSKFGEELNDEAESFYGADCTHWVKTGPCSATQQKASYIAKLAALSDGFAGMKSLIQAQYGRDLEDLEDEQEPRFDAKGTACMVSVGRGVADQQQAYGEKVDDLETEAAGAQAQANSAPIAVQAMEPAHAKAVSWVLRLEFRPFDQTRDRVSSTTAAITPTWTSRSCTTPSCMTPSWTIPSCTTPGSTSFSWEATVASSTATSSAWTGMQRQQCGRELWQLLQRPRSREPISQQAAGRRCPLTSASCGINLVESNMDLMIDSGAARSACSASHCAQFPIGKHDEDVQLVGVDGGPIKTLGCHNVEQALRDGCDFGVQPTAAKAKSLVVSGSQAVDRGTSCAHSSVRSFTLEAPGKSEIGHEWDLCFSSALCLSVGGGRRRDPSGGARGPVRPISGACRGCCIRVAVECRAAGTNTGAPSGSVPASPVCSSTSRRLQALEAPRPA